MEQTWSSNLLRAVNQKNNVAIHLALNELFHPEGVQVGTLTFPHRVIYDALKRRDAQPLVLYNIQSLYPFAILWIQNQYLPNAYWSSFSQQIGIKLSPYYRGHTLSPEIDKIFQDCTRRIDLGWQPPVKLPDKTTSPQLIQRFFIRTLRRIVTITTDDSRFLVEDEPVLYHDARTPCMPTHFQVLPDKIALWKLNQNLGLSRRSVFDPAIYAYSWFIEHAFGSPYYSMRLLLADRFPQVRERLPITSPSRWVAVVDRIS